MKKIISLLLCISLCIGVFGSVGTVFAAEQSLGYISVRVENLKFTPTAEQNYPTGVMLNQGKVKIKSGDTLMKLLLRTFDDNNLSYNKDEETGELIGGYLSSIGGLAAFDGGSMSGWMISINDWFATVGADAVYPSDGDVIVVAYSLDWGADLKSDWSSKDTTLSSLSFEGGELSPEFSPETTEYELVLNRDVEKVSAKYEAANKNYQVRTYKNAEVTGGVITGEAEYENELSSLKAHENDLKEELGYYKNGKNIDVGAGDVLTVGCGLSSWQSMNENEGGTVYTITVKGAPLSDFETRIDEQYTAFSETDAVDRDAVFALYNEYLALSDFSELSKAHIKKLFELFGQAYLSELTFKCETLYTNAKIKLKTTSSAQFDASVTLRAYAVPRSGDDYDYSSASDLCSSEFSLNSAENEITFKVGDMARKLKTKERVEFYLDFEHDGKVLYSQFIGKTVVRESESSDSPSSFRPSTPTKDTENTENTTPEEVITPSAPQDEQSPYVYFSVPEKQTGVEAAYTDMADFSWAAEAVNALTKDGVLSGASALEFNPGDEVTREQFVKMLVLAFNIDIPTSVIPYFTDVDTNAWYAPYVYAAAAAGITNGDGFGSFGTGQSITREDIASMLHRAIGSPETDYVPTYVDASEIAEYAKMPVYFFAYDGTISGYMEADGTYFRPKQSATRAEAAKMIYKAR